ncbi:hypothetical protein M426DRAFT_13023 [Hypoxylon sp. CI-4A]|nr:hypothetical protein M426DRAFT_13023 [Hypoxylon sp. CI-4A]
MASQTKMNSPVAEKVATPVADKVDTPAPKPNLTTLPTELVLMIMDFSEKKEVKSLRGVNKRFNKIVAPSLFRRVYASPNRIDLHMLQYWARHPHLSQLVKELVWCGVYYHRVVADYCETMPPPQRQTKEGRLWYTKRLEDQEMIHKKQLDFYYVLEAVSKFPNLKSVVFVNHWCSKYRPPMAKDYPRWALKPYGMPSASVPGVMTVPGVMEEHLDTTLDHGILLVFKALYLCGRRVKKFAIHNIDNGDQEHEHSPFSRAIFPYAWPSTDEDMKTGKWVFEGLEEIKFGIFTYRAQKQAFRNPVVRDQIKTLFTAAKNVECVKFNFNHPPPIQIPDLFGTGEWPRLRDLRINCKSVKVDEIVSFLTQHAETIEYLEMHHMWLDETGKSWDDVIDKLREVEWPRLQEIHFRWLNDWKSNGTNDGVNLAKRLIGGPVELIRIHESHADSNSFCDISWQSWLNVRPAKLK